MPYQFPPDVEKVVKEEMATGHYATEDELLRAAMYALRRHNEEVAAIQAGIDDMEAGRSRPFEEADAHFRAKFGFAKEA